MKLAKYLNQQSGIFPKLGAKPKKGDRIKDSLFPELQIIDIVSRGVAYTVPPKGSTERFPYILKNLRANKSENVWEYVG